MKSILALTALLAAGAINLAVTHHADADDACPSIGELARTVMKLRQHDVALSKVIAVVDTLDDAGGRKAGKALVMLAYQQPDFSSEEMQASAIAEFGNAAELACYSDSAE